MNLSALLVCGDEAAAQVLRRVLEELSIKVESCPGFGRAAIRLAQDRFDVVIVEGESNSELISLLRESRVSRLNDATLAIAVVSGQETIRELFSLGVNFVLYKPVGYDRALSSLRAARAVMRKEKRKSARTPVYAHATVDYADAQQERATLVDLAQQGMAVRFGRRIPPTGKVYFQFQLPGQSISVRLSGQVIWQDWNGRAGVQFVDVPKASRRLLSDFLSTNQPADSDAGASESGVAEESKLSLVTVEMEEPLQAAAVAAGKDGQSGEAKHHSAHTSHEKLAAPADDRDNRRTQTRYSCRLGAEVYRTGTAVPNHCCLTDLSSGGCYLEVSLPFASGSSVEILVRTYEMKLRLRGTVQAAHPGYGMGVAFELKTKEERENVKKLIDFVAATTNPSN
ncbi:MAG TPA: PilZ domain-containing protein [Candidatus Sulfotelmatobacter sp.]|nr:PilZ domain-containing protein [Candidatus Sulfotelmatobacter sp.]